MKLGLMMLTASWLLTQGARGQQPPPLVAPRKEPAAKEQPAVPSSESQVLSQLTGLVARSGRPLVIAEKPSERLLSPGAVTPGTPPLLSFRYFEGKQRHRYAKLDLVMDDAGH